MQRDVLRGAAVAVGLLAWAGHAAASPPTKPASQQKAAARRTRAISAALCGRLSQESSRALALDAGGIPGIWKHAKAVELEIWLKAPECADADRGEADRSERRRAVLEQLRAQVDRARALEQIEADVVGFLSLPPIRDDWFADLACEGCEALHRAAVRLRDLAASLPQRGPDEKTELGPRLDAAAKAESWIFELCDERPSPAASKEIETRFLYYSWTASGARLLTVAALFARVETLGGCRDR